MAMKRHLTGSFSFSERRISFYEGLGYMDQKVCPVSQAALLLSPGECIFQNLLDGRSEDAPCRHGFFLRNQEQTAQ